VKIRITAVPVAIGFALMFAIPCGANEFYTNLLERGKAEFQTGQMDEAAKLLRIASFGLLDSLAQYETAQVYLAIAQDRLGNEVDARQSITNVFRAEQIEPTYRTLDLSPAVRSAFEKIIARLMPDYRPMTESEPKGPAPRPIEAPSRDPGSTPGAASAQGASAGAVPVQAEPDPPALPPVVHEQAPAAERSPAGPNDDARRESSVEIRDLEELLESQPESNSITLALSDAHLRAGNLSQARDYAEKVLARDSSNAVAHTYLARVGVRQKRWQEAADHYTAARSSISLGVDDEAALFVCYVEARDYENALKLKAGLSESVLQVPAVANAVKALDDHYAQIEDSSSSPDPPPPSSRGSNAPGAPPSPPTREDIFVSVRQAREHAARGDCNAAVSVYRGILAFDELERFVLLALGHGLATCGSFRSTLEAYGRVQQFQPGEEEHMFRMAVALYETGSYQAAREFLKRALMKIPITKEVAQYREKIEGRK